MTAQRLARFVVWVGWVACLGAIVITIILPRIVHETAVQWSPWLVGLLFTGIPHGALDHRVGKELGSRDRTGLAAGPGFYVAYLGAVAFVLAIWFASPIAASVGFLAVAAVHFGQGDVYWSQRFGLASQSGSRGYRTILLLTRSLLPIALPLLAFPGEFDRAAEMLAMRLFGQASWSIPPQAMGAGLAVLTVVVVLQIVWATWLAWGGDGATKKAALGDVMDTFLLVATFAIVPPILALGIYFNTWHALRHIARLLMITRSANATATSERLLPAFVAFQKSTLPMTCGALAILAGLGWVFGRSLVSVVDLGLLVLVMLSMLTLPHVLVVTWMDARQGVWSWRSDGIL